MKILHMMPNKHIEDPTTFMAWCINNYPEIYDLPFNENLAIELVLEVYREKDKILSFWIDNLSNTPRVKLAYIDFIIVKMALYEVYKKRDIALVLEQYTKLANEYSSQQCVNYITAILHRFKNEETPNDIRG